MPPASERFDSFPPSDVPLDLSHNERAAQISMGARRLSARDAGHGAVELAGVSMTLSYAAGFHAVPGFERVT